MTSALTGLATTGSNAFQTRFFPLEESKLPALCIYSRSEEAEYATIGTNRTVMHVVEFTVEAYAKATSGVEDTTRTRTSQTFTNISVRRHMAGAVGAQGHAPPAQSSQHAERPDS
mgnify:CR=1 FL=1